MDEMDEALSKAMKKLHGIMATKDLAQKCAEDVQKAIGQNLQDQTKASALYITMDMPLLSAMFVMGLMSNEANMTTDLSSEEISERALFSVLFCWSIRDPSKEGKPDIDKALSNAKRIWEAATGKTFDGSWLDDTLAKHLPSIN